MGFHRRPRTPPQTTAREAFDRGVRAYEQGDMEAAIAAFSIAIEVGPPVDAAYYQRGMAHARSADLVRAVSDFEEALRLTSNPRMRRDICFNVGLALERSEDFDGADAWYQETLSQDPLFEPALNNRARVLLHLDRDTEAVGLLDRAIELDPNDWMAYWNRAIAHKGCGQFEEARDDLEHFSRTAPEDHPYRRRADEMLRQLSGSGPGLLEREVAKSEVSRLLQRIRRLLDDDRFEEALDLSDRALELDTGDDVLWDERAYALAALGRTDEALEAADRGVMLHPASARLHYTQGSLLDEQRRYREAVTAYRKYVDLAPEEYAPVVATVQKRIRQLQAQGVQ
jgi:tetratricopeptide (TPR) repeat protein